MGGCKWWCVRRGVINRRRGDRGVLREIVHLSWLIEQEEGGMFVK